MSAYEELHTYYIQAMYRRNVIRVPVENITHFKADNKYVIAHHVDGQLLLDAPLIELEQVYGDRFIRVHHNALVSRDRLQGFQKKKLYSHAPATVLLVGTAEPVGVSRRETSAVQDAVEQAIARRAQAGESSSHSTSVKNYLSNGSASDSGDSFSSASNSGLSSSCD